MKVLVLGSINIDYTYHVGHITTPKETQESTELEVFPGGKGLNQAITLTRAGMETHMAGLVGEDGAKLLQELKEKLCFDISLAQTVEGRTGHAILQVDNVGQNAIMIYGGANRKIDEAYVDSVLEQFEEGDVIVLQNETSCVQYAIDRAYEKGMFIVFNPSPCTKELVDADLSKVSMLFLNEVEGRMLTKYVQPGDIMIELANKYPNCAYVFTLGANGAFYQKGGEHAYHKAVNVPAVDATAAGDVFEGYFLAAYLQGAAPAEALKIASHASALSVTKAGAAYFCAPRRETVEQFVADPKHRPEFEIEPLDLKNA